MNITILTLQFTTIFNIQALFYLTITKMIINFMFSDKKDFGIK